VITEGMLNVLQADALEAETEADIGSDGGKGNFRL
jgi:hypothetical protein